MTTQQTASQNEAHLSAAPSNLKSYPTLKKSLSASLADNFSPQDSLENEFFSPSTKAASPPKQNRASPPVFIEIPKLPSGAEIAFTALQYLPTPVLVLSDLKTVLLANDAMGLLLGLDKYKSGDSGEGSEGKELSTAQLLQGQTLSQIGVDMLQDGQPIWVSWEKFLDGLANEMNLRTASSTGSSAQNELPTITDEEESNADPVLSQTRQNHVHVGDQTRTKPNSVVHDYVVDVVLSSQFIGAPKQDKGHKPSHSGQVQAKMIISIWMMDNQRYFTLSFSSVSRAPLSTTHSQSRSVSRVLKSSSTSPTSTQSSTPPTYPHKHACSSCGAPASSTQTSPSSAPLSMAAFPASHATSTPSVLQKTLKMKDAILDAMEIPIIAMWKDESLAFPNRAAMKLMGKDFDPTTEESYDPLSRFKAYTEDFSRELEPDEYPIIVLCRTQKPFKSRKIGMKDTRGRHKIYDVSGEGIFDEKSGKFVAGMTALKDVTVYTDLLKSQSEQNEQQFELICDTMPEILWTAGPGGHVDWFSKRWYNYTGLDQETSLGLAWTGPFHPEDMPETSRRWNHSLATGDEYVTEYRCRNKDGAWRWMLGRALPYRDPKTGKILKWFGTCTDIHELIQARQSEKRLREQLLSVIENAKVTMWSVDRHRNLSFFEGPIMTKKGLQIETDDIGRNFYEVLAKGDGAAFIPQFRNPIEEILAGKTTEHVSEHLMEDNGRWYRTRFAAILGKKVQNGALDEHFVDGVVGTSFDVTELKKRTAELQSQEARSKKLLAAENAAKEASRLKSQFLANMSHEIRTPIAGVIGMSELLIDTDLSEEQRDCAENIQRSANALLTVINDILDLSKVESGRLDIEEVQFSLSVVIGDVSKMMSFAAERKKLRFIEDIDTENMKNLVVLGDPGRCRQILTNLLTNSIKFTSEGYVKLSIAVTAETEETISVSFTVEDTGIGIEEDVKKKLFKPFSQADSSTARRFGGTGLGLTISKNLVDLMHGEITLESVLGSGTKASFTIPFNKPQYAAGKPTFIEVGEISDRLRSELSVSGGGSEKIRHHATTPQTSQDATFRPEPSRSQVETPRTGSMDDEEELLPDAVRQKTHVLVVEDNAVNQQIALKTIKKLGFSANAVWNGKEALDYLVEDHTAERPKPDIILCDIQMPVLDGYRTTHLIRHHNPYSSLPGINSVPIVAMTASAIQGDREKCERAGMDDYLAKPVKGKILEKMLVKWALRSKSNNGRSHSLYSQHTDHDSNCTDFDRSPSIQPTRPPLEASSSNDSMEIQGSMQVPTQGSIPTAMPARVGLPSMGSEGDRGLLRAAAEEKATELRNDKLLNAACEPTTQQQYQLSPTSDQLPLSPSLPALTEENMGKFGREQAEAEAGSATTTAPPRLMLSAGGSDRDDSKSESSLMVEDTDGSSPSTVGELRGPEPAGGRWAAGGTKRRPMNRNNSDMSQKTITPASPAGGRAGDVERAQQVFGNIERTEQTDGIEGLELADGNQGGDALGSVDTNDSKPYGV